MLQAVFARGGDPVSSALCPHGRLGNGPGRPGALARLLDQTGCPGRDLHDASLLPGQGGRDTRHYVGSGVHSRPAGRLSHPFRSFVRARSMVGSALSELAYLVDHWSRQIWERSELIWYGEAVVSKLQGWY